MPPRGRNLFQRHQQDTAGRSNVRCMGSIGSDLRIAAGLSQAELSAGVGFGQGLRSRLGSASAIRP